MYPSGDNFTYIPGAAGTTQAVNTSTLGITRYKVVVTNTNPAASGSTTAYTTSGIWTVNTLYPSEIIRIYSFGDFESWLGPGTPNENMAKHFRLMNDISSPDWGTFSIARGSYRPSFSGTFDGGGHTINLQTNLILGDYHPVGLFSVVSGEIKNLHVVGGPIIANHEEAPAGAMAGRVEPGGRITNSSVDVNVSGGRNVGGLVGENFGIIRESFAAGNVTGTYPGVLSDMASGAGNTGGLVGMNAHMIINSYAISDVNGVEVVGGLVGLNTAAGRIENSFAAGSVGGIRTIAGIAGMSVSGGMINNSVAFNPSLTSPSAQIQPRIAWGSVGPSDTNYAVNMSVTGDIPLAGSFSNGGDLNALILPSIFQGPIWAATTGNLPRLISNTQSVGSPMPLTAVFMLTMMEYEYDYGYEDEYEYGYENVCEYECECEYDNECDSEYEYDTDIKDPDEDEVDIKDPDEDEVDVKEPEDDETNGATDDDGDDSPAENATDDDGDDSPTDDDDSPAENATDNDNDDSPADTPTDNFFPIEDRYEFAKLKATGIERLKALL